jgi:hypothetical protein
VRTDGAGVAYAVPSADNKDRSAKDHEKEKLQLQETITKLSHVHYGRWFNSRKPSGKHTSDSQGVAPALTDTHTHTVTLGPNTTHFPLPRFPAYTVSLSVYPSTLFLN